MKKKTVQYTIENPCHENWSKMTPTERGRFCDSCSKTVVDFTSMTDAEVMKYMASAESSVCSKMRPDQLNRDFTRHETGQSSSFSMHALVLGAALSTFSALSSCASKKQHIVGYVNVVEPRHSPHQKKEDIESTAYEKIIVPASVLSENKKFSESAGEEEAI